MERQACPHSDDISTCATCARTRTDLALAYAPTQLRKDVPQPAGQPTAPDLERSRVGRYVVLNLLGTGGMGVVYAAYDPALDRKVAIKLLRAGTEPEGGATRLLREAQAMAQLAHPNVVPVYDVGSLNDSVFVAMELVTGTTLRSWLKSKTHDWREVLSVMLGAARGLDAAHAAGLVHRDFKPANVLIGEDGRPRITDFGLVRSTRTPSSSDLELSTPETPDLPLEAPITQAGAIMGTPGYMAPEQYEGAETSFATDQYAFCVSLYEGLYGVRPFRGADVATLSRVTREGRVPAPPREASVPAWLFPIIARGLALAPGDRHPSMAALIAALQSDPARRRNLWATALGTLFVASAVVLTWGWQGSRAALACREEAQARLAGVWDDHVRADLEASFENTGKAWAADAWARTRQSIEPWVSRWAAGRADACEATRVRHEQSERQRGLRIACYDRSLDDLKTLGQALATLTPELATQASAAVNRLSPLATCDNVRALEQRAERPEAEQRAVDALEHRVAAGRVLLATGRLDEARRELEPAAADSVKLGITAWETAAWEALGELELVSARLEPCRAALDHAARVALAAGDEEAAVRTLSSLVSLVGWRLERPNEALQLAELASGLLERVGRQPRLEAGLSEALGDVMYQKGERTRAMGYFQEALKASLANSGHETADTARLRSSIGWILVEYGRLFEARAEFEQARATRESLFGTLHPSLTESWSELASIASATGEYTQAAELMRKSVDMRQQLLAPGSFATALSMGNLALMLAQAGAPDEAQEWLERAAAIIETDTRPTPHIQLLLIRAYIAFARHQFADSVRVARLVVHDTETQLAPDHTFVAAGLAVELMALVADKRHADALEVSARLLPLQSRLGHSSAQEGLRAQLNTAQALRGLGRLNEALETLEVIPDPLSRLEQNDLLRAETWAELATALGAANRDLPRARTLAEQARQLFDRMKRAEDAGRLSQWLKLHQLQQ